MNPDKRRSTIIWHFTIDLSYQYNLLFELSNLENRVTPNPRGVSRGPHLTYKRFQSNAHTPEIDSTELGKGFVPYNCEFSK